MEASMSDQKQSGEAVLWTCIFSQTFSVYFCLECHIYWAESRWDLSCHQIPTPSLFSLPPLLT